MQNNFIPQGVTEVTKAIQLDNDGDYEKALPSYKRALEYFTTGLKYEQNPTGLLLSINFVAPYDLTMHLDLYGNFPIC